MVGTSGCVWQPVILGRPKQQEKGVHAFDGGFLRIIQLGVGVTLLAQRAQPGIGFTVQVFERAEANRLGRAGFGASGGEAADLAVVAEGAFKGAAFVRLLFVSPVNDAERTRDHAVAAAVADVVLDVDGLVLGANDRAGRTGLETAGHFAMFADVREEHPTERIFAVAAHGTGNLRAAALGFFEKKNVAPCGRAQADGVVVGKARPTGDVGGHVVPFLARYFTRLAPDAHRRVGEESNLHTALDVIVPPLIRAMDAFADHNHRRRRWWNHGLHGLTRICLRHGWTPLDWNPAILILA